MCQVILCTGTETDKVSFIFDAMDLDSDGYISFDEFARFMHGESTALSPLPLISSYKSEKSLCGTGVVNIRGALEQWESVKRNLGGEELRRVASGATDPIAQLLGQFKDSTVTVDEEQKILKYFAHLDADGDNLITKAEFCRAVSTEMWAGMLVRAFSRPAPPPTAGSAALSASSGRDLGARQSSAGLVRTKSALARAHGMSREQIDAIQRLLPTFTVPDLRRLLDSLRQRSPSLSRSRATIPGAEFKTILAQLIPASPDAPEMAKLSASFFSFLFDRADSVASSSGQSAPDFAECLPRHSLMLI